jgi:hypothetical protein
MVHPGTLFIGDSGALLCIPMKIGVKSERCTGVRRAPAPPPHAQRGGAAVARDGVPAERGALPFPSARPSAGPYSIALRIQLPCGSRSAGGQGAQGAAMPLNILECRVTAPVWGSSKRL